LPFEKLPKFDDWLNKKRSKQRFDHFMPPLQGQQNSLFNELTYSTTIAYLSLRRLGYRARVIPYGKIFFRASDL